MLCFAGLRCAARRMAVSLTTTINTGFGSKVLSESTGILLNNQMDDFSSNFSNVYGIPSSPRNFIRPGKKPFSSMSPCIVEQGGALRMVVGASGGPRIISAVLQTILRVLSYGDGVLAAVSEPRLHHQLVPDTLFYENWTATGVAFKYSAAALTGLELRGHPMAPSAWGAVVQAVVCDVDGAAGAQQLPLMHGASDPRKDGAPAGY